ncbi:MAG: hypothetical protein KAY24_13555 [Candidatus Eisenbacteria sp.]|nr:hypothetical protein [Candidatus Eisenbacteria bacterium]
MLAMIVLSALPVVLDFGVGTIAFLMILTFASVALIGIVKVALDLMGNLPRAVLIRRLVVFTLMGAIVLLGYLYKIRHRPPDGGRARDVIVLTSIDMWADAISMFDDIVRIRFRYENKTDRDVDAFNACFHLRDEWGHMLIEDHISVANPIGARKTSTWTVKYWATCAQGFTPEQWEALTHRDIADFDVEWYPEGLVFSDGEAVH